MNRDQARREAILVAQQKIARDPLYLDTETTGLGPFDEVVELSIITCATYKTHPCRRSCYPRHFR
jgi:uncharacterized protein YprB with RNaseH-like and TPR domain